MINAVLAIPPIEDFYITPHRLSSLGAESVAKILRSCNVTVKKEYFPLYSKKGSTIVAPKELKYLKPFLIKDETGITSFFSQYKRFGPDYKKCAEIILDSKPNIIFIACFAYAYVNTALSLASEIKKLDKKSVIIIGGAGATVNPDLFINHESINFVLTHEVENSLPKFIKQFKSKSPNYNLVENLYFKNNLNIISKGKPNNISVPKPSLVLSRPSITKNNILFSTALTRGCPRNCSFCSIKLTHFDKFRKVSDKSIDKLIDHILLQTDGIDKNIALNFEDDNLLFVKDYLITTLSKIRSKIPNIKFFFENGIDYQLLTPEFTTKLINLGVSQFNLTLGSKDSEVLSNEKRSVNIDKFEKTINICTDKNIPVITYIIAGLKNDSIKSLAKTLVYLYSQNTKIGISMFYAVPGLDGFEINYFKTLLPTLSAGTSAYPWHKSLSTKTLITAFRVVRWINAIKYSTLSKLDSELVNKIKKEKKLYTILKENKKRVIIPVENSDSDFVKIFFNLI